MIYSFVDSADHTTLYFGQFKMIVGDYLFDCHIH